MAQNTLTEQQKICEPSHGTQNDADLKSNREYRSTVFTSYFSIPEHAAQLYEGLVRKYNLDEDDSSETGAECGTEKMAASGPRSRDPGGQEPQPDVPAERQPGAVYAAVRPEDIVFETLDGVLYLARKNDLAFTVQQKILVIGEHQTTLNENMPLRSAIYFGRTMERLVPARAIYRNRRISIPTPEFYVFFNGKEPQPKEKILSISDSYLEKTDNPMLELKVKVINVNLSSGHPILQECRPLYEYSCFMERVREYLEKGETRDEAIRLAVEDCVRQGIMADYLQKHGSEVRNMLFTEFNLDDAKEVWQEEAKAEGRDEKLTELICKKLRKNKNAEMIAEELEEELPKIQKICHIAAAYAPDYDVEKVLHALG